MKKFEYKKLREPALIRQLNELGAVGWEIVATTDNSIILKREIQEEVERKLTESNESKEPITLSEVYRLEEENMTARLRCALTNYAEDYGGATPFYLVKIDKYRNVGAKTKDEFSELQRKYRNA